MLSFDAARKIEPELESLTDDEILEIISDYQSITALAFEHWYKEKECSKIPLGYLAETKINTYA